MGAYRVSGYPAPDGCACREERATGRGGPTGLVGRSFEHVADFPARALAIAGGLPLFPGMPRRPINDAARSYPPGEEIANAITHGLGTGLGIAALVVLVVQAARLDDPWRVVAFSVYGATLIALYLASTLYHSIPVPAAKRVLQRLDHAAIYLFIAGSYTPILLVTLRGAMGWTFFGIVWGVALAGCALEFIAGRAWRRLSLGVYIALGWTSLLIFRQLWDSFSAGGIALLVSGGATYTAGVAFYVWKRLPYSHAIWHLFVLGGSVCHFLLFLMHVMPLR